MHQELNQCVLCQGVYKKYVGDHLLRTYCHCVLNPRISSHLQEAQIMGADGVCAGLIRKETAQKPGKKNFWTQQQLPEISAGNFKGLKAVRSANLASSQSSEHPSTWSEKGSLTTGIPSLLQKVGFLQPPGGISHKATALCWSCFLASLVQAFPRGAATLQTLLYGTLSTIFIISQQPDFSNGWRGGGGEYKEKLQAFECAVFATFSLEKTPIKCWDFLVSIHGSSWALKGTIPQVNRGDENKLILQAQRRCCKQKQQWSVEFWLSSKTVK